MQSGKVQKGLSAKLGLKKAEEGAGHSANKEILRPISAALLQDSFKARLAEEMAYHQYGSPFLQTMLLASQDDT